MGAGSCLKNACNTERNQDEGPPGSNEVSNINVYDIQVAHEEDDAQNYEHNSYDELAALLIHGVPWNAACKLTSADRLDYFHHVAFV